MLKSKIEGLRSHYGIDSPRALAYFEVHIQADREHSRVERDLLSCYVNETNAPAVMQSVEKVLAALWEMLSGVERRYPLAA